jgi:hypothetical protein
MIEALWTCHCDAEWKPRVPGPYIDELMWSPVRDCRSASFVSYAAQMELEICRKGRCKPCIIVRDLALEFAARITLNLTFSAEVHSCRCSLWTLYTTLRTGDANLRLLRFCVTTVKDECKIAFWHALGFYALNYTIHGAFFNLVLRAGFLKKSDFTLN